MSFLPALTSTVHTQLEADLREAPSVRLCTGSVDTQEQCVLSKQQLLHKLGLFMLGLILDLQLDGETTEGAVFYTGHF